MASAEVTSITVESYARSAGDTNMYGFALRIGSRSFQPRRAPGGNKGVDVFEFEPLGEDIVNIEIMDAEGANGAVGSATLSLCQERQAGRSRVEVPVIHVNGHEQLGILSLVLQWPSTEDAGEATPQGTTTSATAVRAALATREEHAAAAAEAEARKQNSLPNPFAALGFGPGSLDDRPAGQPGEAAEASTSSAPAPSAAVMAAMVAVAAMVAAAAELPAPSSPSPSSLKGSKGGLVGSGAPDVVLYPRIQPYDSAPPLEFGPGQLPTSSTGAASFYPDIAIKIFRHHIPARLQELRPTFSAPGA